MGTTITCRQTKETAIFSSTVLEIKGGVQSRHFQYYSVQNKGLGFVGMLTFLKTDVILTRTAFALDSTKNDYEL